MVKRHLVLGCGPAGLKAADKIRETNGDYEIKLVSMEDSLPYCPASLPYLLAGRIREEDLWLRDEDYFLKKGISFTKGKQAVRVLPDKKCVIYKDGDVDEYDALLIATGAETSTPHIEGLKDINILNFRTLTDYLRLNSMLSSKTVVAIIGAGMVAIEIAMALVERGINVKIIGRGRPLRSYFDEQPGTYIADILTKYGIQITTGKKLVTARQLKDSIEVVSDDGQVFEANLLINCSGVTPRISFVEGSGIKINQGIVVDSQLGANISGIFAAGDVAEAPDFFHGLMGISAILPSATDQGRIAGENMSGKNNNYKGWIPMNLVNLFDKTICSLGLHKPRKSEGIIMEEKDDEKRYFKRLVFEEGELVGAMFVNSEIEPGIIRYLIEHKVKVGRYKELLFYETNDVSHWLMLENEKHKTA